MNIHTASPFKGFFGAAVLGLFCTLAAPKPALAAFGVVNSGGYFTVDTGAGLVFKVAQSGGDIKSIRYNNIELQDQSKGSHIASGLGATSVTSQVYGSSYIKITASTSTISHYYIARSGYPNIYMATYVDAEPAVGELRFIARLQASVLPNGPTPSDLDGNTGAIESADIFGLPNGQTRSKYYGNDRAIDLIIKGATGNGVGAWMHYGSREGSSGGPFFRDIQNQQGADQEIYNYMNSGHNQTDLDYRLGVLQGPYALLFTNGTTPSTAVDYSFISGLGLKGFVPDSARGYIFGKAVGIPAGVAAVVGFSNPKYQGWVRPSATTGNFSGPALPAGDYTMTLYKNELAVTAVPVTISAGVATSRNITSAENTPAALWRIGEFDGTPSGFAHAANIPLMHPSDVRQGSWNPTTFTVGSSSVGSFPAAQFKGVNNPTTIKFNLSSSQLTARTCRIGITSAYEGGRPRIHVNGWNSAQPGASLQPDSRSITIGTYRGNNTLFTYDIPASAFVAGTNTMTIETISGSGAATGFLSANFVYDCVQMDNSTLAKTVSAPSF